MHAADVCGGVACKGYLFHLQRLTGEGAARGGAPFWTLLRWRQGLADTLLLGLHAPHAPSIAAYCSRHPPNCPEAGLAYAVPARPLDSALP